MLVAATGSARRSMPMAADTTKTPQCNETDKANRPQGPGGVTRKRERGPDGQQHPGEHIEHRQPAPQHRGGPDHHRGSEGEHRGGKADGRDGRSVGVQEGAQGGVLELGIGGA